MQTVHYRRWAPRESRIAIEFPLGLLREICCEARDYELGTLFGSAQIAHRISSQEGELRNIDPPLEIRAMTSRRDYEPARVSGLELVGIYICRPRGEVFLTEDDLLYMDQSGAPVALVVAGQRAGFFVREADGSIQSVRSYEEFSLADVPVAPRQQNPAPAARAARSTGTGLWKSTLLVLALLSVPAGAVAYLRPLLAERPIQIAARSEGQQLTASWDPAELPRGGRIEIMDAGERTILHVPPGASSAVYQLHAPSLTGNQGFTRSVTIRLNAGPRAGTVVWSEPEAGLPAEAAAESAPASLAAEAETVRTHVQELEAELKNLQWVAAARDAQILALAKQTERLSHPPE